MSDSLGKTDSFRQYPLLFDGAMGTEIQKIGLQQGTSPESVNIDHPDKLMEIHREYIKAGARIIGTNTFGANRMRLNDYLKNRVEEINIKAAEIALKAAGEKVIVAGSVGPTGSVLEPFGELSSEEAEEIFTEQISALLQGGVEIILIETMMSLDEAMIALRSAKRLNVPLSGVTMTFNITGGKITTPFGETIETVCRQLADNGADFIGSNCGNGFSNMLEIGRAIKEYSSVPVLLQPNAGLPEIKNGRLIYRGSPDEFASFAEQALEYGVEYIGGCCGTDYSHIEKAAALFR
jgi:5-methyltetrahydrofolate--homocysteine methyltransferase